MVKTKRGGAVCVLGIAVLASVMVFSVGAARAQWDPGPPSTPTPVGTPTAVPVIPEPTRTPTPDGIPVGRGYQVYVTVMVYGAPTSVDCYVGGVYYDTQITAVNSSGVQQATFILWPKAGEVWGVSIVPHLPPGLSADDWEFKVVSGALGMQVERGDRAEVYLQIVSAES